MRWCGKAFALLQRSNRFCLGKGIFRFCYLKKSKQGKSGHEYFSLLRQDCGRGLDHLLDYWGQVGNIATPPLAPPAYFTLLHLEFTQSVRQTSKMAIIWEIFCIKNRCNYYNLKDQDFGVHRDLSTDLYLGQCYAKKEFYLCRAA